MPGRRRPGGASGFVAPAAQADGGGDQGHADDRADPDVERGEGMPAAGQVDRAGQVIGRVDGAGLADHATHHRIPCARHHAQQAAVGQGVPDLVVGDVHAGQDGGHADHHAGQHRHQHRPQERLGARPGRAEHQPAHGRQGPDHVHRQRGQHAVDDPQRVRLGEHGVRGRHAVHGDGQRRDHPQRHADQQAHADRPQRGQHQRPGGLGQHHLRIGHRQRLPEQHAAVAAVVVERAQRVEEHHEGEDDAGHDDAAQEHAVAHRAERLADLVRIGVLEDEAAAAHAAPCGDAADHGQDQVQADDDRAGDQRRPEEAAPVFPVLALEQPLELGGAVRRCGGCGGQGVHA